MPLDAYQRFAYRLFGGMVDWTAGADPHLRLSLQRAHLDVRPEVFLATAFLNTTVAFLTGIALAATAATLSAARILAIPLPIVVLLFLAPFAMAIATYVVTYLGPDLKGATRARDIDAKLPYALNYISTMAGAGMTPERIFASLAQQRLYGEVAQEAAWIARDLRMLGQDVVTALATAADRSPSIRFQDLLQGAITTITSGGELKQYFLSKSEQFVTENRADQRRFIDGLGILAESYVTVVVAAPVFIIVLLSIMISFGRGGTTALGLGYLLVLIAIPLAQLGFAAAIRFITPEA